MHSAQQSLEPHAATTQAKSISAGLLLACCCRDVQDRCNASLAAPGIERSGVRAGLLFTGACAATLRKSAYSQRCSQWCLLTSRHTARAVIRVCARGLCTSFTTQLGHKAAKHPPWFASQHRPLCHRRRASSTPAQQRRLASGAAGCVVWTRSPHLGARTVPVAFSRVQSSLTCSETGPSCAPSRGRGIDHLCTFAGADCATVPPRPCHLACIVTKRFAAGIAH